MKKIFGKAISVLLVAVMVLCAAPLAGLVGVELPNFSNIFNNKAEAATYGGSCGTNLTWTLDTETGELTISGTGDMWDWSWANKKTVPWYNYRSYIKSLIIGNGVTSIGDSAFNDCEGITNITIGNNITSIGSRAFYQCEGLVSVVIGNSVINIDERAFWNCRKLSTVTIGKGVKSIGDRAFCACYSLVSITVDSANTAYSNDAYGVLFNKSQTELIQYSLGSKRTSYTIPDSVTSIANGAFFGCEELTSVKIGSNVNSIGEDVFQLCKNLTSITIPHGVTSISKGVFGSCYDLKSITIPDSVKNIGDSAFANCSDLTDVYYSGTEEEWGSISVGDYNDELANATVHFNYFPEETTTKPAETTTKPTTTVPTTTKPAETTTRPTTTTTTTRPATVPATTDPSATATGKCGENLVWSFYESTGELVISGTGDMYDWTSYDSVPWWYNYGIYIHSVVIIDEVTSIGDCAFMYCGNIENVMMPDSLSIIGNSAFEGCYDLKSITIPDGVISIGNSAFDGCDSLTSVTIPDRVTSIGDNAFNYCTELRSITVSASLKTVGTYAFDFCPELTDVYYKGTEEEWDRIVIGERNSDLIYATIHFNYDPEAPTTTRPTTTTTTTKPTTTTTRPITTTTKPTTTKPSTTKPAPPPVTESAAIVQILQPSQTTISYGDSIVLHARINGDIPQGATIEWSANNGNFTYTESADGSTCTITPSSKGDTTFTAIVYDANGNIVSADEQVMTSKAGFFDKIIAFFKKLFGLTKTIPQIYKGIY